MDSGLCCLFVSEEGLKSGIFAGVVPLITTHLGSDALGINGGITITFQTNVQPCGTAEFKRIKELIKAEPNLNNWSRFLNRVLGSS